MGTRWRPSDVCLINPSNYKICLSEMCVCLVVNQLSQVCGTTLYYECGKSGKNMEMQVTQTSDMSNHAICNNQKKCACLMEYTLLQSNMAMENRPYIDVLCWNLHLYIVDFRLLAMFDYLSVNHHIHPISGVNLAEDTTWVKVSKNLQMKQAPDVYQSMAGWDFPNK